MKRFCQSFFFIIFLIFPLLAQPDNRTVADDIRYQKNPVVLLKPHSFADEGVGVMDKGQFQNLTMNFGQITDTRYEDVGNAPTQYFYDFRYPRKNYTGLSDDFSLFFAVRSNSKNGDNGNVIDGWTDNDNEDWVAKDGSYGKTHYNPATDPNPHEQLLYPPDNPTTPYLAHSDLPATWPVDETGVAFWPGYFRRDPATGEQIPGEFASDRDVYGVFTDAHNQQGNTIGIEVEMMAYCYGRPYADKFQFYEFFIHNTSGRHLDSCFVGYYMDPDCSDYGEEIAILPDATFSDPDIPDVIMQRDIDGDRGGATRPTGVGTLEDYSFGIGLLETPQNVGVTSFHFFADPGPTDDRFLWPIITNNPTDPDIASFSDQYFHGSNTQIDDPDWIYQQPSKMDLAFIVASGPFSMEPGEVVKSTIVVAVGNDDADFYRQIEQAVKMYEFSFVGPSAPPSPTLQAIPGDGKVTLYWDSNSESVPDPFTNDVDFEGYRIYRSEDNGQTWGEEVKDSQANLVGYIPRAQFDLNNGISGVDSRNPLVYLGDDTGLRHTFVDDEVYNGIAYAYTIVAYDRGDSIIYSLESARGTSVADRNFTKVTPRADYSGKIPSRVKELSHAKGIGRGEVQIEIIDGAALTTDNYEISFSGSPATGFDVTNLGSGQTILSNTPVNSGDNPVTEGFQISILSEKKIGGIKTITDGFGKDVNGKPDSSQSWLVSVNAYDNSTASLENRIRDYQIRFTDEGAMAYSWGAPASSKAAFQVDFQVWDVTPGSEEQLCFQVLDNNGNGGWDEGEAINIVKVPYPNPQVNDALPAAAFPIDFPYRVDIANAPADTLRTPPKSGDLITIQPYRSFSAKDTLNFSFKAAEFDQNGVDLSEIRVVPNPYIVGAAWEEIQNVHQIRFMFLPPACNINIYTISGEKVNTIRHNNNTGDELFNLVNFSNQALSFGVYVYVVDTPFGAKHIGKFAIIR